MNSGKETFTYFHPIYIRFSDLDAQGHVNNAVYLTYLESARLGYYQTTGIWDNRSGAKTGMVVAHIDIDYVAPIFLGQSIQVGLRMARLGNKSMTLAFQINACEGAQVFARGKAILVVYDDAAEKSTPIPEEWRNRITQFEKQKGNDEIT